VTTGTALPPELAQLHARVQEVAASYGLDFFQLFFEMVDFEEMNTVAAYDGFPVRYPHWRFGMAYDQISKSYAWGFSKIYELVINNDPCYAYLLKGNSMVEQKLVMAHVHGHCDFFKNNAWFGPTNRKMVDVLASHATRVRRIIEREGRDTVERFLDSCLSLENLIDVYAMYVPPRPVPTEEEKEAEAKRRSMQGIRRFEAKPYMESFINPPQVIAAQLREMERRRKEQLPFPESPERDILWFLITHAPLRPWQRDLLAMVRTEAYYFAPQRLTKIMNEGWASYWHSRMLTEQLLDADELVDYADRHSGAMGTDGVKVNPYKLGIELFRDIEERWNKGRFGKDYEECDDRATRRRWDTGLGKGREKIFEVRRFYNDVTFVDEFLTPEFCDEQKLFTWAFNPQTGRKEITGRDFGEIKEQLLRSLANGGQPIIEVTDGNFNNRGELVLTHRYDGQDLDLARAQATLKHLHHVWGRPVHIETIAEEKRYRISCDGEKVAMAEI